MKQRLRQPNEKIWRRQQTRVQNADSATDIDRNCRSQPSGWLDERKHHRSERRLRNSYIGWLPIAFGDFKRYRADDTTLQALVEAKQQANMAERKSMNIGSYAPICISTMG